ncbi:MAG: hypothetical protein ABJH72_04895 [Reichenbachiella sp.]|uniref:hypothetical protein n=1 Tax=Reichenbachiella sp. TaxID=2184521 RepID=UPI003262EED7
MKNEATDGTRSVIDASLYDVVASGSNLQVWPSQSLRAFYTVQDPQSVYYNAKLMVEVRALVDEVGNELEVEYQSGTLNNFAEFFTMYPNYAPPAGARQLTDIAAERIETGEVAVNWASYESYDETMLERSRDGLNFTEIARYNGNIDSHMDEVNFSKVVFYRLKQTIDTTVYYSKTVAVETDNLIPLLVTYTYPMPFDGREFRLSVLTNNLEEDLRIQVMNTTDRVIANQSISAETLNNLNVKIGFDEPLKPGIYHMQMVQGKKRSYQKLLVVN